VIIQRTPEILDVLRRKVLKAERARLALAEWKLGRAREEGGDTESAEQRFWLHHHQVKRLETQLGITPQALSTPGSAVSLPRGRHAA
jgi:hypothetical protein